MTCCERTMVRSSLLGTCLLLGIAGGVSVDRFVALGDEAEISFDAVPADRWTGEPYELAGNRMVFTSWYYVRPGGYAWIDEQGNNVSANRAQKIGPVGPRFQRGDDAPWGIRLVVEEPVRRGPIIDAERPWEEMGLSISFILREAGRYRAWGSGQDKEGKSYNCYFESADGLTWKRPDLDLVDFEGSKKNNLVISAPQSVFVDPNADPAARYKGVSGGDISMERFREFIARHPDRWEHRALRKDAGFISVLQGHVSPDGLNWTALPEPFTVEHSDTQIVGTYDAIQKKFIIFTRTYFVGPRSPGAPEDPLGIGWLGEARGAGRRSIGRTESDTFGDFPVSRIILAPRSDMKPSELLYTNCYTTIPGAPDHHLLFPTVWGTDSDSTHLEMAASHDGRLWNWVPGGRLMETAEFGRFDGGSIFWHPNLIELAGGDFALPYTGYEFPHKYPRGAWSYRPGYAVWPKGRIVAVEAAERGEFSTVSFLAPGRKLRINAVTLRAGSIQVAVTRRDGVCLPGHSLEDAKPIVGDQHWTPVEWTGGDHLGFEEGQPISLRFRLRQAKIYGLQFE